MCPRDSSRGAGAWHALTNAVKPATMRMLSTMCFDTRSPFAGRFGGPAPDPCGRVLLAPDAAGVALSIHAMARFLPACFSVPYCRGEMLRQRTHRQVAACAPSDVGHGPTQASISARYSVGFGRTSLSNPRRFRCRCPDQARGRAAHAARCVRTGHAGFCVAPYCRDASGNRAIPAHPLPAYAGAAQHYLACEAVTLALHPGCSERRLGCELRQHSPAPEPCRASPVRIS